MLVVATGCGVWGLHHLLRFFEAGPGGAPRGGEGGP